MGSPGLYQRPESKGILTIAHGQGRKGPSTLALLLMVPRTKPQWVQWPGGPAGDRPHAVSLALPTVALPPEKTDGVASGDEKRREKANESCPGSKKQLTFEVSSLSWCWALARRVSVLSAVLFEEGS